MRKFLLLCTVVILAGLNVFGQCDWDEFNTHKVMPGETVFGISQAYGLSVDQLIMCNDSLAGDYVIKPGQVLRIPVVPVESAEDVLDTDHFLYHQVEAGQTLYSISKMYPDLTVEQIQEWNNLEEPVISIGQYLVVGELETKALFGAVKKKKKKKVKSADDEIAATDTLRPSVELDSLATLPIDTSVAENKIDSSESVEVFVRMDPIVPLMNSYQSMLDEGREEQFAKGVANYLEGTAEEPLVVLCDNIALGTIVKIRNLINNQITYAKVIGKLPGAEDDNIMVKLSYSTAKKLNVLDRKVLVEMSYMQ